MKKHLIWFNGTSEKLEHNCHLFNDLNQNEYTVIPGWGTGDFNGHYYWPQKSSVVGVKANTLPRVVSDIKGFLAPKKPDIEKVEHLIIGGFSRGAAFFVPFFLKHIQDFVSSNKTRKLTIFLIDPVTGSANKEEETAKTLESQRLLSVSHKENLIRVLSQFFKEIDIIFLCVGFDARQNHFKLDRTFYDAVLSLQMDERLNCQLGFYSAKLGFTHSALSTGSKYSQSVFGDMRYGDYTKGIRNNISNIPEKCLRFNSAMNAVNPDVFFTKRLLNGLLGAENADLQGVISLDHDIEHYHQVTEKYLGDTAADNDYGVSYWVDNWAAHGILALFADDAVYSIEGHSRLRIEKNGSLNNMIQALGGE